MATVILGTAVALQVLAVMLCVRLGRLLHSATMPLAAALLLLGAGAAAARLAAGPVAGPSGVIALALSVSAVAALAGSEAWMRRRRGAHNADDDDGMLRRQQDRSVGLSLFLDEFPAHIWTTDASLKVDFLAGRGLEPIGVRADEAVGGDVEKLFITLGVVPEHRAIHRRALAGETVPFLTPLRGSMLEGAVAPLRDADGAIVGTIGLSLNVSERERATEQARTDEQTLHEILDHTPATVFIKDRQGRYLWVNRRWEELSRKPRHEVVGRTDFDLFSEESARGFRDSDEKVWSAGEALNFVLPLIGRRRTLSLLTSKFLLRDRSGQPWALCGMATDITERSVLEEELQRRQALLVEAQAMASLASWEMNFSTQEQFVSHEMITMLGLPPNSRLEEWGTFLEYVVDEDRQRLLEHLGRALFERAPYDVTFRIRRADGELRWLRSQGRIEYDDGGVPVRIYGFTQEVTEERRSEEEIRRLTAQLEEGVAERTRQLEAAAEELSSFSYAVSHDLRQPLRSIAGFLALFDEETGPSLGPARHYLERARNAVRNMDSIIADLLALARVTHAPLRRDHLDLTSMAREIARELRIAEPGRVVRWEIADGLRAWADEGLVRQMLENLMSNAFKFTRKTAAAVIEVGVRPANDQTVFFVRDNGAGFDPSRAKRLFEPFQRLHDAGEFEGSGIGLATVARIVRHHGGWIRAEARPQHGATFLFTLPALEDAEEEAA